MRLGWVSRSIAATVFDRRKSRRCRHCYQVLVGLDRRRTRCHRLLPLLRQMMNPSKFILTSRKNVYAESEVAHFPVPELSADSALRLIRREAAIRQSMHLQTARDGELLPIFELTGGNPLALHLVAGQLHVHPIATVLDDLKMARGNSVENLYTHIYASAWQMLNNDARRLLTFMPLTTHLGATIEELVNETGLERGVVRTSMDQLLVLNLLLPLLNQQRYTIHSLTRTFLLALAARPFTKPFRWPRVMSPKIQTTIRAVMSHSRLTARPSSRGRLKRAKCLRSLDLTQTVRLI